MSKMRSLVPKNGGAGCGVVEEVGVYIPYFFPLC